MARNIKYIAVHCTATSQTTSISAIQSYWQKQLGWKMPGYHFIVKPDGELVQLLPIEQVSNGVQGFNSQIINISYIGGVDQNNKPVDNRTPAQKATLLKKLKELKAKYPLAKIQGHRDFPNVHKACPSFDAIKEYKDV
ncbi:N-acetylmuramoyl-L-alanine amidase [uncultured Flavobacterium sp.]|uniref:N-acetylmuramoyl-L-alanine amidase n=1 Tax=uncultured Flavobacterium sp. TaxID=165435 RepID=UPI0025E0ABAB|nr:N-acetylmuramoyl-L-alanine amidase [uncultured Flavobacterium sp.]